MNARFIAALLCALTLAPSALAGTGPFTGTLRQGETDTHVYDNNPGGDPCIDVMVFYTVELTYSPASDVLTLSAGGQTATGSNGYAVVSFMASYCTAFLIEVTGTRVATSADYTVTVTQDSGVAA